MSTLLLPGSTLLVNACSNIRCVIDGGVRLPVKINVISCHYFQGGQFAFSVLC